MPHLAARLLAHGHREDQVPRAEEHAEEHTGHGTRILENSTFFSQHTTPHSVKYFLEKIKVQSVYQIVPILSICLKIGHGVAVSMKPLQQLADAGVGQVIEGEEGVGDVCLVHGGLLLVRDVGIGIEAEEKGEEGVEKALDRFL